MKRFFIIAGESSGDIHGARLMEKIQEMAPDTEFVGIGGKNMEAAGLKSLAKLSDISVVGFLEVIKKYRFFSDLLTKVKNILSSEKFDAFLPIDYPGFNIRVAKFARENNIKVFYYIAPQLWAWGKNRAKKLIGAIDKLLVVFPFEVDYFTKFGINTEFVGHPLMDDPVFGNSPLEFHERENLIALLPGSRNQEIVKHLPLMTETVKEIREQHSNYRIGVAASNLVDGSIYNELKNNYGVEIFDNSRELMSLSKVGLVKTGTSNLEAALLGLPFVMFYKTSYFTYRMGRALINLPYISLINILLNENVVKELIQKDANPKKMNKEISYLLNNLDSYNYMLTKFNNIRKLLGKEGASEKAAKIILNET